MFDRIAPVYDVMNRVMTVGLDLRWRRIAAEAVVQPGDRVLDACCGTGDLAVASREARRRRHRPRLLAGGCSSARAASFRRATWVEGDLLALPFEDGSFEAATVGFGVRNVADLEHGLRGAPARARPGRARGRPRDHPAPSGPLAPFYRLWFDRIVPLLGRLLKGGAAYTYLPASVRRFPGPDELAELMRRRRLRARSRTAPSPAGSSRSHLGEAT